MAGRESAERVTPLGTREPPDGHRRAGRAPLWRRPPFPFTSLTSLIAQDTPKSRSLTETKVSAVCDRCSMSYMRRTYVTDCLVVTRGDS
jgi:hypothetical protein